MATAKKQRLVLTKKQRALQKEISELLLLLRVPTGNLANVPVHKSMRTSALMYGKRQLTIAAVLHEYLVIDELLSCEMCTIFFPNRPFARLWKTKRFRAFNHHILERLYLVQKIDFVRAHIRLNQQIYNDILALNNLRNALAHSFFPENRRVKPKWKNLDIFTSQGLNKFMADMKSASKFFWVRYHRDQRRRLKSSKRRLSRVTPVPTPPVTLSPDASSAQ